MKMGATVLLCLLVILISPINLLAEGFQPYSQEVSYLKTMLDCPQENLLSRMKGFGGLYVCTLGESDSVKLFVSEKPTSGQVLNIGLLWHDRKNNIGYQIHSDLKQVEKTLNFLIDMYVPARREQIGQAFWDSRSVDFSTPEFVVYYTHKEGLQKDSRLIVIEEK
jgi:hypothetical protein